MVVYTYFIGTAGSGKSTLVGAMQEWIDTNSFENTNVITVNFDPAFEKVAE